MPNPGSVPKLMSNGITSRNSTQPQPKRGVRSRAGTQNENQAEAIGAASDSLRVNPLNRFVLSSVRNTKQPGGLRGPPRIRSDQLSINATHLVAGEFVGLSPHFLIVELCRTQSEPVAKTDDSRIPQISYRRMNSFLLGRFARSSVFRNRSVC